MGIYINPLEYSKAKWLRDHGREIPPPKELPPDLETTLVCAIVNPFFLAIAVVVRQGDLDALTDPSDLRPRCWLQVPTIEIPQVSDITLDELIRIYEERVPA